MMCFISYRSCKTQVLHLTDDTTLWSLLHLISKAFIR